MKLRLTSPGADVELMNAMLNAEALWWLIDNDPEQILGFEYCREFVPPLTIYTFTLSDAIQKYQEILRGDPGWQNWEVVTVSNKWKEILDGSPSSTSLSQVELPAAQKVEQVDGDECQPRGRD